MNNNNKKHLLFKSSAYFLLVTVLRNLMLWPFILQGCSDWMEALKRAFTAHFGNYSLNPIRIQLTHFSSKIIQLLEVGPDVII